jgi:general secretion pathway protein G
MISLPPFKGDDGCVENWAIAPDDAPRVQYIAACRRLIVPARGFRAVRSTRMNRSALCARGFTLIEVMVVVVILGLLAAIIVPKVMSRPDEARAVAAKADIAAINQALKLYRLDNTFYPSTEQGLQALVQRPTTQPVAANWKQGGYLDRVPKDPWGREYQYLNPGVRSEIDVFSLGADGAPGGEGNAADVFN